jgi:hypothetical protein
MDGFIQSNLTRVVPSPIPFVLPSYPQQPATWIAPVAVPHSSRPGRQPRDSDAQADLPGSPSSTGSPAALPWPHAGPGKSPPYVAVAVTTGTTTHTGKTHTTRPHDAPRTPRIAGARCRRRCRGLGSVRPSLATKRGREGETTPVSRPRAGLHYPLPLRRAPQFFPFQDCELHPAAFLCSALLLGGAAPEGWLILLCLLLFSVGFCSCVLSWLVLSFLLFYVYTCLPFLYWCSMLEVDCQASILSIGLVWIMEQ